MKPNLHVLIVDAHAEDANRLVHMLASGGVGTHVSADAKSALEVFRTFLPDLVLVDEGLDKHEGQPIPQLLGSVDQGRKTPIVLMSGSPGERRKRSPSLTARGYACLLRRPIQSKELLDALLEFVPQALTMNVPRSTLRDPEPAGQADPSPAKKSSS